MNDFPAFYEMNMKKTEEERRQLVIRQNRRLNKARKGQLKTGALFVALCFIFDFQLWIMALCRILFAYHALCADGCMDCPICGKRFPGLGNSRLFMPETCPYCGTDLRDE